MKNEEIISHILSVIDSDADDKHESGAYEKEVLVDTDPHILAFIDYDLIVNTQETRGSYMTPPESYKSYDIDIVDVEFYDDDGGVLDIEITTKDLNRANSKTKLS